MQIRPTAFSIGLIIEILLFYFMRYLVVTQNLGRCPIDHIAYTFVPEGTGIYYVMRLIGRITAPLMCYFLAEGFRHTHDKKKYLLRLILFAAISQPVYYIYVYRAVPNSILQFLSSMNIMFTLSLSFLCLLIVTNDKLNVMIKAILTAVTLSFAQFGDWEYIIPMWTLIFFFFNKDKKKMVLFFVLASIIILPYTYLKYFDSFFLFSYNYGVVLALIPVALYNGQRSKSSSILKKKFNRWFFYIYYPLHMAVLYFISI